MYGHWQRLPSNGEPYIYVCMAGTPFLRSSHWNKNDEIQREARFSLLKLLIISTDPVVSMKT